MRLLISVLVAGATLALVTPGRGQVLSVEILALDCTGNPEIATIRNMAHFPQDLSGWTLQSDGGQSFNLGSEVGALDPVHEGGQISVYSNSQAPATNPALFRYLWTTDQVFRDGDSTDYVRIVDGAGGVVDQENCPQAASQEPTPSPSQPAAAPSSDTGAPQAAQGSAGAQAAGQQLPASGGRPYSPAGFPPLLVLALGAATLIAGAGLLALSRRT